MSSPLLSALNKSLRGNTPRTLNGRTNMIGEVISFGEKSVLVKALNGPMVGQEMDIALPTKGRVKMKDFTTPSKAQTSMHTEIGGVVRFDGVEKAKEGDGYSCSWINSWIKAQGAEHKVLPEALTSMTITGRTTSSGYPNMRLQSMEVAGEKKVGNLDELEEALAEAFAKNRGALVIDITDAGFGAIPAYLNGEKVDGHYVFPDPAVHAKAVIEKLTVEEKAVFAEALSERGMVVVPMSTMQIGGKTAESIEMKLKEAEESGKPARIMTVNPLAYEAPSIGLRLANALARKDRDGKFEIPKEHSERLATAFVATAAEDAKAAFHGNGWAGVSDTDLKEFFAGRGVTLKDHPAGAWNRTAIHLQKFEGDGDDYFVAKTHELARYGNPYPALECTKDLRQAYAVELVEAVKAAMAGPVLANAADEPKAEVKVDQPEGASKEEIEALDDMLDDVLNGDKPGM